jgi:hypothetical protein
MLRSLFSHRGSRRPAARTAKRSSDAGMLRFRPTLFSLETREVLSSAAVIAPPSAPALVAAPTTQVNQILPLSITNVVNQAGGLVANGLLGSTPFTAPVTLGARPNAADPSCPILDLMLGPIDLDLLGLEVKTSQICLSITAEPGPGNLLGNLLCGVGNLLNGGTPLGDILGGLTSTDLGTLTSGLTGFLNGALGQLTTPFSGPTSQVAANADTNVLNLSLGPVDLNLLGLNVHLDDCNNGPVTVDIIAHSGPGKLLGNLIGAVAHLLDGNGNGNGLTAQLNHIGRVINSLV